MDQSTTVVGLDVHKAKIVAAVLSPRAERAGKVITLQNHSRAIERLVNDLAATKNVVFVYEAGPCGYEVQRQIAEMGYHATVIAPALIPIRPVDRVKTNRRDAERLAHLYRAGELTEIRVPTRAEEAARDLVRIWEDFKEDRVRARHRLDKFLLRQGRVYRETKSWGVAHRAWLRAQQFAWAPLQQTFDAYLRALEETEARLDSIDKQILEVAQVDPYRIPVQYLRCLKGRRHLERLDAGGRNAGLPAV